MKRIKTVAIGMVGVMFIMALGCGMTSEKEYNSEGETESVVEYPTGETKVALKPFMFGEVQGYESVSEVFGDDDKKQQKGLSTFKNDYASAQIRSISDDSLLHAVSYTSPIGSVKDLQFDISIGNSGIPMGSFYEADMNNDSYKDLIISYWKDKGTGGSRGIYVYDLKNRNEIPVLQDGSFTETQKNAILSVLRDWCVTYDADVKYLNMEQLNEIHISCFSQKPVLYNEKMAIYVSFQPLTTASWIDLCKYEAILVERDGEYVVDKMWCSGEWRK